MQPLIKFTGLSEYNISQDLSSSTKSDSAVNFLLEKYHGCREKHAQCNFPERLTSAAYPSRLLDVGIEEHSLIILRGTRMFCNEEYVCLSHCWGDIKPFTLNAETQSALARGINVTALPKTFQDAILVTRRLRIQYLWIDSLYATTISCQISRAHVHRCILQDNKVDWATESGRMGHIYAHASCTIAATASKDSSGGLFFDRSPKVIQSQPVHFDFSPKARWLEGKDIGFTLEGTYLCDVQHLAGRCIEDAPLNSRAWVSQERQLSRRLLHFTSTQLFWECYECTACETYPGRLPDWARPFWQLDATLLKDRLRNITDQDKDSISTSFSSPASSSGLDDDTYFAWGTYRYQYSRGALTHNTDKLVAIHGIANRVSQATGDEFVAGLWRSRIIEELCWSIEDPTIQTTEWRAPTWSWASSNAAIESSLLSKFHNRHSSRHIAAELIELKVKTKTSGELEDASMKIRCKLLHAIFTPAAALESPNEELHGLLELIGHSGDILECELPTQVVDPDIYFCIDDDNTKLREPQYGYVVVLQQCLHERESEIPKDIQGSDDEEGEEDIERSDDEESGRDCLEALFLRTCDKVEERFERMGLIHFQRFRAVKQVLEAHRMAEDNVITLI
jgi:hypothetical protein